MINTNNLLKYLILFLVTTTATKVIPTCGVLQEHAIYVGLISASTFALIDICSPNIIIEKENKENIIL
tara:strand:+ start:63 stop:266 length:204 start_codon:yes stop_codon:yes gene_type:complete